MAEIDGGALSFTASMDNTQLDASISATLKAVRQMSESVADGGKVFDATTEKMIADSQALLAESKKRIAEEDNQIDQLRAKYDQLGAQMQQAYNNGRDEEARAMRETSKSLRGEIRVRQDLQKQREEANNALEAEIQKIQNTGQKHESLRGQIRVLREEMAELRAQGIDENSEAYKRLANRLGELQDIQGDIARQGQILADDQAGFAGVASGLQGVVGVATAAQGAFALLGDENKDLQQAMLKVQSLMSITMGLQQVANTLNKDSAFMLVTRVKALEWWHTVRAAANTTEATATIATETNTIAETENATAQGMNAVATGAQATAAGTATAANISLAGAIKMVSAAIKSIPGIGWILAGVSALIGLITHFTSKAAKAREEANKMYKDIAENAYKPVNAVMELHAAWNALGDDFEAKKKYIENNKKKFDELGVAINGVTEAENLLASPEHVQTFVNAQIKKAEAMLLIDKNKDKVEEILEAEQKLAKAKETPKVQKAVGTSSFGSVMYVETDNPEIKKQQERIDNLRKEITGNYEQATKAEQEGAQMLKEAGIDGAKVIKDGTIAALQDAIKTKQELLQDLVIGSEDFDNTQKEIADLQAKLDKATNKKTGGAGGGGTKKDAFKEQLDKYKKEYTSFQKWVNSGDAILVQSANKEFEHLLAQGKTYIDYLKNQRDIILSVDVSKRTKEQNAQLRTLNDAIAEETKKTVLEAFNTELADSLTNAKTVLDMLNIIEAKRKELANDGTELDDAKKEELDKAEKDAQEKLKQDTESLLEEYASYMERKRMIDEQYNRDVAVLEKARAKATSEDEQKKIDDAIAQRTKKYQQDSKTSGSDEYDKMLEKYGSFEQRKQAIVDEYAEKRKLAEEMGNTEMLAQLDKAEKEALSKFALDELQASPDWEKMFGNLDEITTTKLQELIAKFESLDGVYLGIQFDPKDLEALKNKIQEAKDEIRERNPFKALVQGIKEYSSATDKEAKKKALKGLFESASGAIDLVKGSLDAVVGGMQTMGIEMDAQTEAIINDLGGILDGASKVAEGIASGNPLSVIQGSIGLLSSAFDLFNGKDRAAEERIKAHQKAINSLQNSYKELEWQIGKALGGDVYAGQMDAIKNMREQQKHLLEMQREEQNKKKTDDDKVKEYQEQYAELTRNIEDMFDEIAKDILQTDAKSFAGTLGDSLVEAFAKGESASKAFEATVNDVLKNAIVNQLKKQFLEKQLQGALDSLQNSMGYWSGDNFVFDGLTDAEIADFKAKVKTAGDNFTEGMKQYENILGASLGGDSSLSGAVKGVTEETAGIVAGQMNAIRMNQQETSILIRQQLQALNTIAMNTHYNRYLTKLDRIVSLLESGDGNLRANGLS